jgi:hypothetical protein
LRRYVTLLGIRLATRADAPALLELESRHYIGNLDPHARSEGFISILHSAEWFNAAVDCGGVHVGLADDNTMQGFIAITPPPVDVDVAPPILRTMMELSTTVGFNGRPIAEQCFAFRGPVLIDRAARGQGLYAKFNRLTHEAYRHRYDVGVLFVAAENPRSLHAVSTKLGASALTTFDVDAKRYHFLAFNF